MSGIIIRRVSRTTLTAIAGLTEKDLLGLHGVGPKALRLLQEALEQQGMSLG